MSRRSGFGTRAAADGEAMSLTMWPRNDGSSTPSIVSVSAERGLANCPAMRPTFTTGTPGGVGEHDGHLEDDLAACRGWRRPRTRRRTRRSRRPGGGRPRPSATWPSAVGEAAGLAGEHERGQRRQRLEARRRGRPSSGHVGLLRGWPVAPRGRGPGVGHRLKRGRCRAAGQATSIDRSGGRGGRSDRKPGERAVPRLRLQGRWVCPCDLPICTAAPGSYPLAETQAASMRSSACSRTALTARFTRRRAASAVTPSSSPTSR